MSLPTAPTAPTALQSFLQYPGNTILPTEECQIIQLTSLEKKDKKRIILASNEINDDSLFINGLTQNIIVLYDLFEALGYTCHLLQTTIAANKKPFLERYRYMKTSDLMNQSIHIFVEIGMSIDEATRRLLRKRGTRVAKLYLGNILNIDIETIQLYPSMFFNHHIVGELDEIWTSPHYKQHVEYAAVINRTSIKTSRVVPYVWDPCFIQQYAITADLSPLYWEPTQWEMQDIVITDPSISFQKCSFYSILLVEAFAKAHPEWKGKLHIVNGDRLKLSSNSFNKCIAGLQIYQANRMVLYPRKKINQIMADHRSACFITHQWNNSYNYMTLELISYQYPILHNSEGWEQYGYYYSINDWSAAIETLYQALTNHKEQLPIYKSHATNLIWKHNIHNPGIQERWRLILE